VLILICSQSDIHSVAGPTPSAFRLHQFQFHSGGRFKQRLPHTISATACRQVHTIQPSQLSLQKTFGFTFALARASAFLGKLIFLLNILTVKLARGRVANQSPHTGLSPLPEMKGARCGTCFAIDITFHGPSKDLLPTSSLNSGWSGHKFLVFRRRKLKQVVGWQCNGFKRNLAFPCHIKESLVMAFFWGPSAHKTKSWLLKAQNFRPFCVRMRVHH